MAKKKQKVKAIALQAGLAAQSSGAEQAGAHKLGPPIHSHDWKYCVVQNPGGYFDLKTEDTGDVPVRLFFTQALLDDAEETIYTQIINATRFPGVKLVVITPDAHFGYGVPVGSVILTDGTLASIPSATFSTADYYRGLLDADGSLGLTGNGFPFVSLVTASEYIATAYLRYLQQETGKAKLLTRNKRDGVFNIVVYKEDAQAIASTLYYDGCLALPRKKEAAATLLTWIRPITMRKVDFEKRSWTSEDDSYIKAHNIAESSMVLRRTKQSIKMRLWRLRDQ